MDSLDLDQVMDEIIPRGDNRPLAPPAPNFPVRQRLRATDDATAALDLVSQAAAAIKELEKQSAQAVARAHSAANAVREKLERAEDRGDRAEAALRKSESEAAELSAALIQTRKDLDGAQSQLAARQADLAAMEQRAVAAEKRASEADASVQRIVDAIRTQLPVKVAEQAKPAA
ncbi:ABC transporter permease [Methylocystis hirsuta]|uniref:ABC transporter permease n=1 Tax=Methylocystis hirsuta TaxID=369798 RepID=A0A3M9XRV2_9HYPH|nr:ABC transporter permease [Methylocystis hirsuta]RNJ50741.1 ABC transporter permease [Methylocystis hirsuta]